MKYTKTYEEIKIVKYNEKIYYESDLAKNFKPKFKIGDAVKRIDDPKNIIYAINGHVHPPDSWIKDIYRLVKYDDRNKLSDKEGLWIKEDNLEFVPDYKVKSRKYNMSFNESLQDEFSIGDYVEYTHNSYKYLNLPWYTITEIDDVASYYKYKIKRIDNKNPYKETWVRKEDLKKVPKYKIISKKYIIYQFDIYYLFHPAYCFK